MNIQLATNLSMLKNINGFLYQKVRVRAVSNVNNMQEILGSVSLNPYQKIVKVIDNEKQFSDFLDYLSLISEYKRRSN